MAEELSEEEKEILKAQKARKELTSQLKDLSKDIFDIVANTSKAQTSFQKSLGLSVDESLRLTNQLAKSATFSQNINVSFRII